MAVTLLKVGDHLSLEFDPSDLDAVRMHIRERHPDVIGKAEVTATAIHFGGDPFTFQHEWDDPCLISSSDNGDDLLRAIHRALT